MLHILNGDAVTTTFVKSEIGKHYVVWRELLCQGPTRIDLRDPRSWAVRAEFLSEFLGLSSGDFINAWPAVVGGIERTLKNDVTLWFEYDLFCQINLLAAVSLIHEIAPNCNVSLVVVGQTRPQDRWITLGHLGAKDWKALYPKRKLLSKNEKDYVRQSWEIYCSAEHKQFDELMSHCPGVLKYLPQGIENHYRRFHSRSDGFTDIQRFIFNQINQEPRDYRKSDDSQINGQIPLLRIWRPAV